MTASAASPKDGRRVRLYSQPGSDLTRRFPHLSCARRSGLRHLNEHLEHEDAAIVFRHACKLGLEGIVSKRRDSPYQSGRCASWIKMKNPVCEAVRREAEEDWGCGAPAARAPTTKEPRAELRALLRGLEYRG